MSRLLACLLADECLLSDLYLFKFASKCVRLGKTPEQRLGEKGSEGPRRAASRCVAVICRGSSPFAVSCIPSASHPGAWVEPGSNKQAVRRTDSESANCALLVCFLCGVGVNYRRVVPLVLPPGSFVRPRFPRLPLPHASPHSMSLSF